MDTIVHLQKHGYMVFRCSVDPSKLESCTADHDMVYYRCMQRFIEEDLLSVLNKKLGWHSDYVKFRYSNNNNSADASGLHRDIILQKDMESPCYTCLTYLDRTCIEVIPGSHLSPFGTFQGAIYQFAMNRIRIVLEPGDVMLFSSALLHRGLFQEHLKNRRVLQVFEVFPNSKQLLEYNRVAVHILGGGYGGFMTKISKTRWIEIFNFIHYINCFMGYNVMYHLQPQCIYLSSEGMRPRVAIQEHTLQESNCYVLKHDTYTLPDGQRWIYYLTCFCTQIVICLFIVVIMIAVVWLLRRHIRLPRLA